MAHEQLQHDACTCCSVGRVSPDGLGCAGMLAADGRCKTLDAAAQGYVRAEAVGAVWLRCLTSVAGLTLGPKKPVSAAPSSAFPCSQRTNIPGGALISGRQMNPPSRLSC